MLDSKILQQIQTPEGVCAFLSLAPANVAFHAGHTPENEVIENRNLCITPFMLANLAFLNQIHSNIILKADNGGILGEGDGLIITRKNIIGMVMVADCNPILLFDTKQKIIILLHAGRLGVERGIISNACRILTQEYKSNILDIFAYVGPSIRACCYAVKEDVFTSPLLQKGRIQKENAIHLDLIACVCEEFKQNHLKNYHIAPHCTSCEDQFFSYRRNKDCGRFGLFAYLT